MAREGEGRVKGEQREDERRGNGSWREGNTGIPGASSYIETISTSSDVLAFTLIEGKLGRNTDPVGTVIGNVHVHDKQGGRLEARRRNIDPEKK
jgi:hypothetical protein